MLPPSEGKTPPNDTQAATVDLESLVLPELAQQRAQVMEALISASRRDDAQQVLKVGASVLDEVAANTTLHRAPTAPSYEIYTGVLFDALEADQLNAEQLRRAAATVLIFSGLFGVTGFTDRISSYRCAMDVKLPELGNLGSYWRHRLAEPLAERVQDQLVVDCRSASYVKAFRPPHEQTLAVNSFMEKDGHRKVVTHFAKAARGELTGMLLRADSRPESVDDVAHVASQRWKVEVRRAEKNRPHQLDLISSS